MATNDEEIASEDTEWIRADNENRAEKIGCEGTMKVAMGCGLSDASASISMDVLTQDGLDAFTAFVSEQTDGQYPPMPRSLWHVEHPPDIDDIPGRRIPYNMTRTAQSLTYPAANPEARFLVTHDGPFVMTHYPIFLWRSYPQSKWVLPGEFDEDAGTFLDLSYRLFDMGSQRAFTDGLCPIFSRPDRLTPLPMSTVFAPNSTIKVYPEFAGPLMTGELRVILSGYRIVNH